MIDMADGLSPSIFQDVTAGSQADLLDTPSFLDHVTDVSHPVIARTLV